MTTLHNHKSARQYGDQYHCSHCGKQWDVNDPEPPECDIQPKPVVDHIKKLRGILNE